MRSFLKKIRKKNLFLFSLLIVITFLFWNSQILQNTFYNSVEFFKIYAHKNHTIAGFIFVGLAALSALLAPLSSVPIVPGAILIWNDFLVLFLLWAGWNIGHFIAYYIGRYAGYNIIKRMADTKKIKHYQKRLLGKKGFFFILFFCLAMPAEVPGYVLGIMRYPAWKYIIAVSLSEIPFAIITIYASDAFIAQKPFEFVSWIIFGLFLVSLIFYLFHKKFRIKEVKE